MRTITVKVHRSNDTMGDFVQDYSVEVSETEVCSVMNLLEKIYREQDQSLAFFHHAACRQAVCGGCLLKVNGKPVLACKTTVTDSSIELAPADGKVCRDLLLWK